MIHNTSKNVTTIEFVKQLVDESGPAGKTLTPLRELLDLVASSVDAFVNQVTSLKVTPVVMMTILPPKNATTPTNFNIEIKHPDDESMFFVRIDLPLANISGMIAAVDVLTHDEARGALTSSPLPNDCFIFLTELLSKGGESLSILRYDNDGVGTQWLFGYNEVPVSVKVNEAYMTLNLLTEKEA